MTRSLFRSWLFSAATIFSLPLTAHAQSPSPTARCAGQLEARVVALDQPWFWNRYGAVEPQGMMYALERDVVSVDDADGLPSPRERQELAPGRVRLRRDKRPRPLVLRVHAGSCLRIVFTNLLARERVDEQQPATRAASIHVMGMQLFNSNLDDGSYVGENPPGAVVEPGGQAIYTFYAEREGTYVMHSMGAIVGGEGDAGSLSAGLFGMVNVEPPGTVWYRSQVTQAELDMAIASGPGEPLKVDYDARYPDGHPHYAGLPILAMVQERQIVHSDLTAIIAGPGGGDIPQPLPTTGLYPQREKPFREFSIAFHDEIGAVQAFKEFEDRELGFTLHSARDGFAINYGTGGIGAEVLANRFGVGPAAACAECKYEEFFLTSWAVGDPAMVVDRPANASCPGAGCTPDVERRASLALYPDDPSNVYHSYLNDHVKFRNTHAGSDDHHVFHLHAHQWTNTPRSNLSSYLDSQSIGQGAGFTYDIAWGGSGNRNHTPGDSIFHCHFYPHFAQGMWSLWRVHDVLELGTALDEKGRPAEKSRALPDGEILAGTPIPAVVPIPGLPLAPVPEKVAIVNGQVVFPDGIRGNPGYPFFVPGKAGHRPPHPPLDTIFDGGLPRHIVSKGTATSTVNRFDFDKRIDTMTVKWLEEQGEPVERVAMEFHAQESHEACKPDGTCGFKFRTNGHPAVRGAPYADPCWDDRGNPAPMRWYKAADFQMDVIFNKSGWHFPQQRMIALQDDVRPTLQGERPPEPLFLRAASGECVEYWLTNLVPQEYQLDDFQVRTPTDILGQHIHLVKFDVTSSDGAANGFNYEDGSFAGEEVQERLCAIRRNRGSCGESLAFGTPCNFQLESASCPVPKRHPIFGDNTNVDNDEHLDWLGAQTTVQRWWADPIPIDQTRDTRTLRTVFTHDHFGPSTHQQAGLYAGLIVEPEGTSWFHNEHADIQLSVRNGPEPEKDGGPTSWQAVIEGSGPDENFREFALEIQDFTLAYEWGSPLVPDRTWGFVDRARAINPPGRKLIGPFDLYKKPDRCPTEDGREGPEAPCPEAVSADDPGMTSFNYRNEPLALRISTAGLEQAPRRAGDLSFAYMTRRDRARNEFNVLPYDPFLAAVTGITSYPPLTKGLRKGDPFTPLLRAYEGDRVVVRTLGGAHEEEHNITIHGMKWLFEPDRPDSGWRNSQQFGISQWFDFVIPRMISLQDGQFADFLYKPTAAAEWQWNGAWGLFRLYRDRPDSAAILRGSPNEPPPPLPENPSEREEDAADAATPEDIEIKDDESLVPLRFQNPDLKAPAGAEYEEIPLADALAEGVVLSRKPETEAVPASTGTASSSSSVSAMAASAPGELNGNERIRIDCPRDAPRQPYSVVAVAAAEVLQDDRVASLVYNSRSTSVRTYRDPDDPSEPSEQSGPLHDPTAILFVHAEDLTWVGSPPRPRLNQDVRREPLILRASKGDCIKVRLLNALPADYRDLPGWNAVPMIIEGFNANHVQPSKHLALHPQLVHFDVRRGDGSNAGLNPKVYDRQTVAPGEARTFYWYAGDATPEGNTIVFTPIEFGSTGLSSSDPIKHANKGAVGAMIIEPKGSTWEFDWMPEWLGDKKDDYELRKTRATATIRHDGGSFKELVLVFQDNVNLRYKDDDPVESLVVNEDPTESAQKAVNYKTEPIWFRTGFAPDTPMHKGNDQNVVDRGDFDRYHLVLSNSWIGRDPDTPVFQAAPGTPTRFRLVHPGGHTQAHVFGLHGHIWEELPYVNRSEDLGSNPDSEWQGARGGHGPTNHHEAILKNGAGGRFTVYGDYLYRDIPYWLLDDGIWGLLRVVP